MFSIEFEFVFFARSIVFLVLVHCPAIYICVTKSIDKHLWIGMNISAK